MAEEILLRKTRFSAFLRTNLEEQLRDLKVDTVVMCGFSTNACVGLTAIDAFDRDFRVLLAGDAVLGTNEAQGELMLDYLNARIGVEPLNHAQIMSRIVAKS